jgi:hypothetical protein
MQPPKMRTIVREHPFEREIKALGESSDGKAYEFMEAIEMVLSRNPQCGHHLGDSHVWFLAGHTIPLVVYYTFDENNVFLLSMQKTESLET